ncbi:MAG: YfcC family protein, partial [Lewinella sp.]|nr:YfcC family protein [Lewinella sp.]
MSRQSRKWYDYIPHSVIILFGILVFAAILSYLLPAGIYDRVEVDGRLRVVPGSFHKVTPTPVGLLDLFRALPLGFKAASEIIFVVLSSGIMFGVLDRSGAIENAVGTLVRKMGLERRFLLVFLLTYL